MKTATIRLILVLMLYAGICGCALGYNRMLFMTKTNVGLDIDSKPPTAEISIARREGVIAPSFEEGKALPVIASFLFEGGWFSPHISGTFAGGKAAVTIAELFNVGDSNSRLTPRSRVCLDHPPKESAQGLQWEEGDDARPFFFATDTTFGLKVAWSGATEVMPDTLKLGYNRKEFAYAPVFGRQNVVDPSDRILQDTAVVDRIDAKFKSEETSAEARKGIMEKAVILELVPKGVPEKEFKTELGKNIGKNVSDRLKYLMTYSSSVSANATSKELEDEPCLPGEYEIQIPSFIAMIDNPNDLNKFIDGKLKYVQFFATGEAANALARRGAFRQMLVDQLAPRLQEASDRQLIEDIKEKFNDQRTTEQGKDGITKKAIELGLVGADTTVETFEGRLAKKEDLEKSKKLEQLKKFAQQQ
jgi:hypothetical protein